MSTIDDLPLVVSDTAQQHQNNDITHISEDTTIQNDSDDKVNQKYDEVNQKYEILVIPFSWYRGVPVFGRRNIFPHFSE